MDGPGRTVNPACVRPHRAQASKGLGKTSSYEILLPENLGTYCREWQLFGKADAEIQILVEANSKPHDIVTYQDGSVTRDRSGWGFTVKQGGRTVHEDSGAHRFMTFSLTM